MAKLDYSCGTCGSRTIVINGGVGTWLIACGNGHPLVPNPGLVMTIEQLEEAYQDGLGRENP